MRQKRKLVYSVTLHDDVAEWLRGLSTERRNSLSGGIARAQALLSLPGVMRFAMAADAAETERYNEKLRAELQRHVLRRDASGRIVEPPPRQTASVPPPTPPTKPAPALDDDDNPFAPPPPAPARQGEPGDSRGVEGAFVGNHRHPRVEPGPMTEQERQEIGSLEEERREPGKGDSRPMDSGTTAPAATEPSTGDATETTPAETIADDAIGEPEF